MKNSLLTAKTKINPVMGWMYFTLMALWAFVFYLPSYAQTGCNITKTGCPPSVSPVCATSDTGVPCVSWIEPDFALNCSGSTSTFLFTMNFDLPESQSAEGCWVFNRVQRVGTDGGKLRLWQSSGTGI